MGRMPTRKAAGIFCRALIFAIVALPALSRAQEVPGNVPDNPSSLLSASHDSAAPPAVPLSGPLAGPLSFPSAGQLNQLPSITSPQNVGPALQIVLLLTVLSLAPALLIMTTSFTRIVIVLSLLRQAIGTQQLPPNQVLIGLALFMTFLIMGPTLTRVNNEAIQPYMRGSIQQSDALGRAAVPVRDFMIKQIRYNKNDEDVLLFTESSGQAEPKNWGQVGTMTLIPAFILSELKTAFLMGFRIYLPFLIVDMVISSVLISMGMMMLPPSLISLPFKLLLFVLVDGWRLISGSLMGSFIK
jgi:flagellar biosynthetic protein FliP